MKTRICYRKKLIRARSASSWVCANPIGTGRSTHRSADAAVAHALAEMGGPDQPHTIRRGAGGVITVTIL